MFENDVEMLNTYINEFKKYQKKYYPDITETNDNGEWVFGKEFDQMCSAYLKIIENYDASLATGRLINKMLYVIARDNECSHLLDVTLNYHRWFEILCRKSIKTDYYNAKWQFAEFLGYYDGNSNITEMIFDFIKSGDEYTERMALKSMCEHYPVYVEKYAIKFWNRNVYTYEENEYQKMMALYALYRVFSPSLKKYIAKAYETDYVYLKNYADELMKDKNYFNFFT